MPSPRNRNGYLPSQTDTRSMEEIDDRYFSIIIFLVATKEAVFSV